MSCWSEAKTIPKTMSKPTNLVALLDPGPDARYFRVEEAATTLACNKQVAAVVSTGNVMQDVFSVEHDTGTQTLGIYTYYIPFRHVPAISTYILTC